MRRSAMPPRTTRMPARGKGGLRQLKPIPRTTLRSKPRSADEKRRIYGTPQRIAWMHASPCVITGRVPCEIVHVRSGGTGRKADARFTVPMVAELHRELHRIGVLSFEAKYARELAGHSLAAHAARIQAEWERVQEGEG